MGILLFFGLLIVAALIVGGIFTILGLLAGALVWLVLLPFRLLFKLTFGVLGALLGLLFTPAIMLIAMVAIVAAFLAGVAALIAPLLPLLLVALVCWGVYRAATRRSAASF